MNQPSCNPGFQARRALIDALVAVFRDRLLADPAQLDKLLRRGEVAGLEKRPTLDLMALARAQGLADVAPVAAALVTLRTHPELRLIRWRTLWSSGPGDWEEPLAFALAETDATVEELVQERGRQDGSWSDHFRGAEWKDVTLQLYAAA